MGSSAQSRQTDAERQFLESLRSQYAGQGFSFVADPDPEQVPDFLGSYRPDAIARKPGSNIVIEVKPRPSASVERSLQQVRRLFEGHPDWQFVVTYMGIDPLRSLTISRATASAIESRMGEVRQLEAAGQYRAAFVLAWSLLEAALLRVTDDETSRPRTPGTVVQTLAMLGYLEPEAERRMRALIELRNRVVHGDLQAEPTQRDIALVLSAVEETLEGAA